MSLVAFVGLCTFVFRGEALKEFRDKLVVNWAYVMTRLMIIMVGVLHFKVEHKDDFDYSKWLGPNWKQELEGLSPGTIIANHCSWMDIVSLFGYFGTTFVAKRSVENIPGVKTLAKWGDPLYVDRAGTKEEKIAVAKAIEER